MTYKQNSDGETSAVVVSLLPCPFCGNDGSGTVEDALHVVHSELRWRPAYDSYTVQCDRCTATMGYSDSEEEAVADWNTRVTSTPQAASAEVLEALEAAGSALGMFVLMIGEQRPGHGARIDAMLTDQQIQTALRAANAAKIALAAVPSHAPNGNAGETAAAEAIRSAFFTSVSGGAPHRYHLSLAYPTMQAMHDAEDAIKSWAKSVLEPAAAPNGNADAEGEVADLKEWVVAFGAPWAVTQARERGLPDGQLHHLHYDILARCGARMDDFTRSQEGAA